MSQLPEDANVKPGEALAEKNQKAHDRTYDENGNLLIKTVKPVAAVTGGDKGTAETGVSAKIQEPVSGETVNPADTVPAEALRGDLAPDHTKETVEVREGADDSEAQGFKDGDISPSQEAHDEAVEKQIDALDIDKTEAAKNSEESVKDAKAVKASEEKAAKADSKPSTAKK